jgi:hypothetical protein
MSIIIAFVVLAVAGQTIHVSETKTDKPIGGVSLKVTEVAQRHGREVVLDEGTTDDECGDFVTHGIPQGMVNVKIFVDKDRLSFEKVYAVEPVIRIRLSGKWIRTLRCCDPACCSRICVCEFIPDRIQPAANADAQSEMSISESGLRNWGDALFKSRCPIDTIPLPVEQPRRVILSSSSGMIRLSQMSHSPSPIPERIRIPFADDVLPRPMPIASDDRGR